MTAGRWVAGLLSLALLHATAAAAAELVPAWLYPLNGPSPATPAFDASVKLALPGTPVTFTEAELNNLYAAPDWYPDSHTAMPDIVAHGREPAVFACGFCHSPSGQGRPENASLAGLPAAYIEQQVADFKSGARHRQLPAPYRPADLMIQVATRVSAQETAAAARYFAAQSLTARAVITEQHRIPKTTVTGWVYAVAGSGEEPLGMRIIEIAPDIARHEQRDDHMQYIAYVPPGSLARGRSIATSGSSRCVECHGTDFKGIGLVPPLAGRSPTYLLRQLVAFKTGTRAGPLSAPMRAATEPLQLSDLIAVAAFAASQPP